MLKLFVLLSLSYRDIFDEDNYTPMSCQDENEYNAVLREFPFDDSEMAQVLTIVSCKEKGKTESIASFVGTIVVSASDILSEDWRVGG